MSGSLAFVTPMFAMDVFAPSYRDRLRVRIDAVFDEFRNRLQGIALRERDDPDRIPVIADAQLPAVFAFRFHSGEQGIRSERLRD
jgi:hypothetical protein